MRRCHRGREGFSAIIKVKNNLLASVLIVTVVPQNVKLSRTVIEHCCYLIAQKLEDISTPEVCSVLICSLQLTE